MGTSQYDRKLSMKLISIALVGAFSAGLLSATAQEGADIAISIGGGSTGGVVELEYRATDMLYLRGGYNYLNFGTDAQVDDIDYNGDFEFSGGGIFVDIHPFKKSFFVSAGAFVGDKAFDFDAAPNQSVNIGDFDFTPAEYGQLEGDAKFKDAAPFLGAGIDTTFTGSRHIGFKALAGAAFFGSGEVQMRSVNGSLSDEPLLQQQLDIEAAKIEDEIDNYDIYPVVQLGLSYRF
jgi:hypothetical protein